MSHLPPLAHLPFSPAADRNKQPILDVLLTLLPPTGHALEVASGTGQHAVWFTAALPGWTWQPTDFDADALPGIDARVAHEGTPRVHPARRLDVTTSPLWRDDHLVAHLYKPAPAGWCTAPGWMRAKPAL
jgi:hypothetical protein